MDRRRFLGVLGLTAAGGGLAAADRPRGQTVVVQKAPLTDAVVERPRRGQQRILWSVDTERDIAALTFDDGPDPLFTPRILDELDRHDVKATFFAMGWNATQHPRLLKEVVQRGHEVGSHGWSHLNLTETGPSNTRDEIELGTRAVEDEAGVAVTLFRPPYGRFDENAVNVLGPKPMDLVVWSLTRGKLAWRDPDQVADHISDSVAPGDIVDLHDGIGRTTFNPDRPAAERLRQRRTVEIEALPKILRRLTARGIRLVTVSELIEQSRAA